MEPESTSNFVEESTSVDVGEDHYYEIPANYTSKEHSSDLVSNTESFRLSGGYNDVIIRVDSREFPGHRVILAAGSPYFHSMFSSGMEECHKKHIDIKQIEAPVFELIMHFIYTGQVSITSSVVYELFRQAHMFQISHLVELSVKFLKDTMTELNCLTALMLGDTHVHKDLYNYAKEYTCNHFDVVKDEEELMDLSLECIVDLLSDRRLNCIKEDEVFQTCIKWLDTYCVEPNKIKTARYDMIHT